MKLLAITGLMLLAAGCKPHARLANSALLTPAQGKAQQAAIVTAWKAGKLTTDEEESKLSGVQDSVADYCANHYCGD